MSEFVEGDACATYSSMPHAAAAARFAQDRGRGQRKLRSQRPKAASRAWVLDLSACGSGRTGTCDPVEELGFSLKNLYATRRQACDL